MVGVVVKRTTAPALPAGNAAGLTDFSWVYTDMGTQFCGSLRRPYVPANNTICRLEIS